MADSMLEFLRSKTEAIRSLFFDKPAPGEYRPPTSPQHFVHATLPNGQPLMVPVSVTISSVLDEQ